MLKNKGEMERKRLYSNTTPEQWAEHHGNFLALAEDGSGLVGHANTRVALVDLMKPQQLGSDYRILAALPKYVSFNPILYQEEYLLRNFMKTAE